MAISDVVQALCCIYNALFSAALFFGGIVIGRTWSDYARSGSCATCVLVCSASAQDLVQTGSVVSF